MVERAGNKLPHPIVLFGLFALGVVVISGLLHAMGVSAEGELINSKTGEVEHTIVTIKSLFNTNGIVYMMTNAVKNFTGFAPLGTVLVAMLGVGVAEQSGWISSLLRKTVEITPAALITPVVVFLGCMSNVAGDAGYVVLIPIGALMFMAYGRHPMAGLAAAFAGVSGGWSANLLIGTNDPMFAGMSTQAARMIDPEYTVLPVCNWYFMVASTVLITVIGTLVTDRLVEPRLGPWGPVETGTIGDIGENERRGMGWAGITVLVYAAVMALLTVLPGGLLRDPQTHSLLHSPFMDGIIFFMMLLFLLPGLAYGIGAGTLKDSRDAVALVNKSISGLAGFMVLIFFAAQFTACFNYSNLGTIISVKGADFLQSVGLTGLPLIVCFILLTAGINIFIAVDSAKWAIMAPIFVPMFMRLGLSPELTQAAYRIGDSSTNIIAPLMPFFVLTVAFFQKYDKDAGIGSVISTMLPYSGAFLLGWIVMFTVWYLTGLPLGPGSPLFYGL